MIIEINNTERDAWHVLEWYDSMLEIPSFTKPILKYQLI